MATQHLSRREFEDWRDNLTGFFETTVDRTVRASERRIMTEVKRLHQEERQERQAEIQEFRAEVKAAIEDARAEFRAEIKYIKEEILDHRAKLDGLTKAVYLILNHLGVEPPKD